MAKWPDEIDEPLGSARARRLVLEGVSAHGRVVGRLLEMQLEQRYRNREAVNIEVVHTIALPWQAVLLGIEVELDGTTLHGVVKARAHAGDEYEQAITDGDSAVLVTANEDGSYTLSLGNLMPGESCRVRLHYVQILRAEHGSLRLIIPTTIAARYGDPITQGKFEPHAVPKVDPTVEYPFDIRLTIDATLAATRIGSPSHPIAVRALPAQQTGQKTDIEVRLAAQAWLDRDFVLTLDELAQPSGALAAWDPFEHGSGVLMAHLAPQFPPHDERPVSVKILVDCSGSMAGDSIRAARGALRRIVASLRPEDRFSLSRFGTTVEHRCRGLWKVSSASLYSAQRWIEALDADMGGTKMADALVSTLALGGGSGPSDVLLITDGAVHDIEGVLAAAQQSQQRIFVVGVGAGVTQALLQPLARDTSGACEFVAPGEDVAQAIWRHYRRMRSPRVRDARIEWPQGWHLTAHTALPGGVFDGDEIVVFAWCQGHDARALEHPIRLRGTLDGEADIVLAEAIPAFQADHANTLARVAAYHRYLNMRQAREITADPCNEVLAALAERYQIVTDTTGFVLTQRRDDDARALQMPALRQVAAMAVAGSGGYGSIPMFSRRSIQEGDAVSTKHLSAPAERPKERSGVLGTWWAFLKGEPSFKEPEKTPAFWCDGSPYTQDPGQQAAYVGLTPAGVVESLRLNRRKRIDAVLLEALELPQGIRMWLQRLIDAGHPADEVARRFMEALLAHDFPGWPEVARQRKLTTSAHKGSDALRTYMAQMLAGVTPQRWPQAVIDATAGSPVPIPVPTAEGKGKP